MALSQQFLPFFELRFMMQQKGQHLQPSFVFSVINVAILADWR